MTDNRRLPWRWISIYVRAKTHAIFIALACCWATAAAAQQELTVDWLRGGHCESIRWVSFSQDGSSLATLSDTFDCTAKRWSIPDGKLQETLKAWPSRSPSALAWSPAGNAIAFGTNEGTLEILDLEHGTSTSLELKSYIRSLAWTPRGEKLIVGRDDPKVLIVSGGAVTGDLIGNLGAILDLDVSRDGLFVAGGSEDSRAYLWRLPTAHLEFTLAGHEGSPDVAISPNGALLATFDGAKLRLWRASNGGVLAAYDEAENSFSSGIEFVGDETIAYALDWCLRSRNLTTGEVVYDLPTEEGPESLAYSPATELLALGCSFGRLELRNARTGAIVQTPIWDRMFSAATVVVSPDGNLLAAGGTGRTVHVLNAQTGDLVAAVATPLPPLPMPTDPVQMRPPNSILDFVFSPDSHYVYGGCIDGRLRKWNATTGAEIASIPVSEEFPVTAVDLFDDGEFALCGLGEPKAEVVRLSDGAKIHVLGGHAKFLRAVAASSNGELLATGDNHGKVRIWNSGSGQLVFALPEHRNAIRRLDFSADGSMLASAGADGLVKIWNTSDGSLLHELPHPSDDPSTLSQVSSATFAPVGTKLVTISDDGVRFWDASDGSSIAWTVPESAFARDSAWFGEQIAFGRRDGTIVMTTVP